MRTIIDKIKESRDVSFDEITLLLRNRDEELSGYLFEKSREVSTGIFGNQIYVRGLIEFTNICKNDCYYCGIRRSNKNANRYRLTRDEILNCCKNGYALGFRTFVLQGGEDNFYTDDIMTDIISGIKTQFPDCAVTLSIGEKSRETYRRYRDAGADRYLLRHETANAEHYARLHPKSLSPEDRKRCLSDLKELGFQVGTGFMVGSPYQTIKNIAEDLMFIREFKPHMIGIGPFIPHSDTIFAHENAGSVELTLFLIGLLRLMIPNALIPATTALGTIDPKGREKGILAGANVLMPNLSPVGVRKKYSIYDNKICTGEEAAECKACLERRMENIGYKITTDRGDYKN